MENKNFSPKLKWRNNSRQRLEFKGGCLKQQDKAAFLPNNLVNLFIVYQLDTWSKNIN